MNIKKLFQRLFRRKSSTTARNPVYKGRDKMLKKLDYIRELPRKEQVVMRLMLSDKTEGDTKTILNNYLAMSEPNQKKLLQSFNK